MRASIRWKPRPRNSTCGSPFTVRDYEKSITDYDAAISINAKNAWSLYGRGID